MLQKRTADKVYKRVKTDCNQKLGKATQFFTNWNPKNEKSMTDLSVMTNLVLQMACKLGFAPWKVALPYKVNDNGRQVMIVGGDVFHMNSKDSVTSVVSTLDKDFTEYYCVNSVQKRRGDDLLHSIAEQVIDCQRKYADVNKNDPDIIIFFRDGIGSGSHDYVRENEIKTILGKL
jgi:aubergine